MIDPSDEFASWEGPVQTSKKRSPAAAASVQKLIQRGALPVTESRLWRAVDGGAGDSAGGGTGAECWGDWRGELAAGKEGQHRGDGGGDFLCSEAEELEAIGGAVVREAVA